MSDQRYRVVLGLSIVKDDTPGFSDAGVVYHNCKYEQVLELQALFEKHSQEFLAGVSTMLRDGITIGVGEIADRTGRPIPASLQTFVENKKRSTE